MPSSAVRRFSSRGYAAFAGYAVAVAGSAVPADVAAQRFEDAETYLAGSVLLWLQVLHLVYCPLDKMSIFNLLK